MIILIDFGGQTAHLISRRIKEFGVECKIITPEGSLEKIKQLKPKGIIFSGGPDDVFDKNAPTVEADVFKLGLPILGICYGHQLIGYLLDGEVVTGTKKEFGPAQLELNEKAKFSKLLKGVSEKSAIWMNHGNEVVKVPNGFVSLGKSETTPHAIMADEKRKIYGIQFHPEMVHTQFGNQILENFLALSGETAKKTQINKEYVENLTRDIKDSIGNQKALCALSGGVDSSVAALLVHRAIGKNLTSLYIDSGLMREGETDTLKEVFKKHYQMNVSIVDAKKEFLKALKGVTDPEQKRKFIGKVFIEIFEKEARKTKAKFLVQGTIYPDVIESAGSKHAQNIKSHHNVGGLPENMNLVLIEPLRNFYKDEVRKIGKILGLSDQIINRQPFPGPGLAVRIIGEVTEEKLYILRKADQILQKELKDRSYKLWQAFTVFTGIKTTGVRGDQRAYGETIAIRAIEAKDAMSANFARLPYELLDKVTTRIVNEIKEVNRVVYDITNKPPATMEWE